MVFGVELAHLSVCLDLDVPVKPLVPGLEAVDEGFKIYFRCLR